MLGRFTAEKVTVPWQSGITELAYNRRRTGRSTQSPAGAPPSGSCSLDAPNRAVMHVVVQVHQAAGRMRPDS